MTDNYAWPARYAYAGLTLLVAFHVVANTWWIAVDNHPPSGDELTHLSFAYDYFEAFNGIGAAENARLSDSLQTILEVRTRIYPPLQHVLGGFLAFVLGAYSYDIVTFVHTIAFALTIIAMFLLARTIYDPWKSLGVAFIASFLPGLYCTSRLFTQEMTSTLIVVLAMYSLVRTDYFRHRSWVVVFSILSALGFLARWSTVFYYFPAVVAVIAIGLYRAWRYSGPIDRKKEIGDILTNCFVSALITVGWFAPWYILNLSQFQTSWRTQYGPVINSVPLMPIGNHERWTRYGTFIINFGVFLPTTAVALLGMLVAAFKARRNTFYLISLAWFVGGYLMMSLVFWQIKTPAPRYALQMLPPLALFAAIALFGLKPRMVRNVAISLFAALLLVQYFGFTFHGLGRFGYLDAPLYVVGSNRSDVPDERAAVIRDKTLLGAGAAFAAPYRQKNWYDRLFDPILEREAESIWRDSHCVIQAVRLRDNPIDRMNKRLRPIVNPLGGVPIASDDYIPELIPYPAQVLEKSRLFVERNGERETSSVRTLLDSDDPIEVPAGAALEINFRRELRLDAVLVRLAPNPSEFRTYTIQFLTPNSDTFTPSAPPAAVHHDWRGAHVHRIEPIQCNAVRIVAHGDAGGLPLSVDKLEFYTRYGQPRPILEGTKLDRITPGAILPNTSYVVVEGDLSREESQILGARYELIDRFDAMLQMYWWPATLSVYARREPPIINFARNSAFQVSVTSDLRSVDPNSRWDVPWWPYGFLPGERAALVMQEEQDLPAYWGMHLPAMAEIDLGAVYTLASIDFGLPDVGPNDLTDVYAEYLDPAMREWFPAPPGFASWRVSPRPGDSGHRIPCRYLRLRFEGDPDRPYETQRGYVGRIMVFGWKSDDAADTGPRDSVLLAETPKVPIPLEAMVVQPAEMNSDSGREPLAGVGPVHVVALGESVADVARRYGVAPVDIYAWNGMAAGARCGAGTTLRVAAPADEFALPPGLYRVKAGDTVDSVARWHGIQRFNLFSWNNLEPGDALVDGQLLFVARPAAGAVPVTPQRVRVAQGDTLASIAEDAGVTVQQIMYWNSISGNEDLSARPQVAVSPPSNPPRPNPGLYPVSSLETWTSIARDHGVSVQQLIAWNGRVELTSGAVVFVAPPVVDAGKTPEFLHPLRAGETLESIATNYGIHAAELVYLNSLFPSSRLDEGDFLFVRRDEFLMGLLDALELGDEMLKRPVRPGDTVVGLALQYDVAPENLVAWNDLSPSSHLRVGDAVYVSTPPAYERPHDHDLYRVEEGDSLTNIARIFRVPVENLLRWNDLAGTEGIAPGQVIFAGPKAENFAQLTVSPKSGPAVEWALSHPPYHSLTQTETAAAIAEAAGISLRTLAAWNATASPDEWASASRLVLVPPKAGTLAPGVLRVGTETSLFGVLEANGIALADFLVWNAIGDVPRLLQDDLVFVGPPPTWAASRVSGLVANDQKLPLDAFATAAGVLTEDLMAWNGIDTSEEWLDRRYVFVTPPPLAPKPLAPLHRLRAGQSLSDVAATYEVDVEAIRRWNLLDPNEEPQSGELLYVAEPSVVGGTSEDGTYQLRWGETLYDVAEATGVRVQDLAGWNGVFNPLAFAPGASVRIAPPETPSDPPAGLYRVQPGDTLLKIAIQNEVTVAQLVLWNGLKDKTTLSDEAHLFVSRPPAPPDDPHAPMRLLHWGETLCDAARRSGVSVRRLLRWNGLERYDDVGEGQLVYTADAFADRPQAPALVVYDGRGNESLANIAVNHGVAASDLKRWNPHLAQLAPEGYLLGNARVAVSNPAAPLQQPVTLPPDTSVADYLHSHLEVPALSPHRATLASAQSHDSLEEDFAFVQPGDTVESLASRYHLSPRELVELNPTLVASRYVPGDMLRIEPGVTNGIPAATLAEIHARAEYARQAQLPLGAASNNAAGYAFIVRGAGEGIVRLALNDAAVYLPLNTLIDSVFAMRSPTSSAFSPRIRAAQHNGGARLSSEFVLSIPGLAEEADTAKLSVQLSTSTPTSSFVIEDVPALSYAPLDTNVAASQRGIYIALIDPVAGDVIDYGHFDSYRWREGDRAADYIVSAPQGTMIAAVVSGDAMFRGRAIATALHEDYGIPIFWNPAWKEPYASPYFRSGMIIAGFRGMRSGGLLMRDGATVLNTLVRRGDSVGDSPFRFPLDLYLESAGAAAGSGAQLRVARDTLRYEQVDSKLVVMQPYDFGDSVAISVRWPRQIEVAKIRVALSPRNTGYAEYAIAFHDEEGYANPDAPDIKFAGPANAIRFFELNPGVTGSFTLNAQLDPKARDNFGKPDIRIYQRRDRKPIAAATP